MTNILPFVRRNTGPQTPRTIFDRPSIEQRMFRTASQARHFVRSMNASRPTSDYNGSEQIWEQVADIFALTHDQHNCFETSDKLANALAMALAALVDNTLVNFHLEDGDDLIMGFVDEEGLTLKFGRGGTGLTDNGMLNFATVNNFEFRFNGTDVVLEARSTDQ